MQTTPSSLPVMTGFRRAPAPRTWDNPTWPMLVKDKATYREAATAMKCDIAQARRRMQEAELQMSEEDFFSRSNSLLEIATSACGCQLPDRRERFWEPRTRHERDMPYVGRGMEPAWASGSTNLAKAA